ncbi:MAG TPA: hypothetical protein VI248_15155 [Kineosporiaceae bacterium]
MTRTALWGRGVDLALFRPERRTLPAASALRETLAPRGEVAVGYVGRLAPEKQAERLAVAADLPRTAIVVVGDGPSRTSVAMALPGCGRP